MLDCHTAPAKKRVCEEVSRLIWKKCVTAASHITLFVLFNRYTACHSMLAAMSNGCVDGKNIPYSTESLYLRLYIGQYL
jgi:hypothetical protein